MIKKYLYLLPHTSRLVNPVVKLLTYFLMHGVRYASAQATMKMMAEMIEKLHLFTTIKYSTNKTYDSQYFTKPLIDVHLALSIDLNRKAFNTIYNSKTVENTHSSRGQQNTDIHCQTKEPPSQNGSN